MVSVVKEILVPISYEVGTITTSSFNILC